MQSAHHRPTLHRSEFRWFHRPPVRRVLLQAESPTITLRDVESATALVIAALGESMVWSPSHGDTAFTVPLFGRFMRRVMPGDDWGE